MADFCNECINNLFPEITKSDFANIARKSEIIQVICEGCGYIYVDHTGRKLSADEIREYVSDD